MVSNPFPVSVQHSSNWSQFGSAQSIFQCTAAHLMLICASTVKSFRMNEFCESITG